MSALITADWGHLEGDVFFRKFEVYQMEWKRGLDMENIVVSAAPYGGPIAVVRDRKKLIKVKVAAKPTIYLFSSSGVEISTISWESGQLLQLGWSSEEELLCIQDNGYVSIYDMFGTHKTSFSMGKEAEETKIIDAKVFPSSSGTGIAVMTSKFKFYFINSVKDPKVRQLDKVSSLIQPPTCWDIIADDRETKIILISKECAIYVLSQAESKPIELFPDFEEEVTGIIEMCVSLDSRNIAMLTDSGRLWLGSSDMRKKYVEIDTHCTSRCKQLIWCGADAVLCTWNETILLVGRSGNTLNYYYTHPVTLIPEIDCVRVLTSTSHEVIQKVPKVTQQIFSINSTQPGSYLVEANKQFLKKSHTADEYMHVLNDRLEEAVNQCIKAAGYEFDPEIQKMLIRAAQFGKTYVPDINSESYVQMCRILRLLNAVRHYKIGLPITYSQLNHLTIRVLLDRLVMRRHFKLAIEIAKYLRLPEIEGVSRVLGHWACYKVKQTHIDQEEVATVMADKLGYSPGISYSQIASVAIDAGRTKLAIRLLDYEPQASRQVPLLLRLEQRETALLRALDSGNTDLIYTVMLNMRDNKPLDEFQTCIRKHPVAKSLYLKYCKEHALANLRDIYFQEDDYNSQAACFIKDFYDPTNSTPEVSLSSAVSCYKKGKNDFLSSLCEEHLKLAKEQRLLEEKVKRVFVGKTLHETVDLLMSMQEFKLAERFKSDFKLSDRLYWWLRIKNLAKLGDWNELNKFSKSKKSPIGYEPFVDVCIEQNKKEEGRKYLPRVRDELKVKYYVKLDLFDEAAQFAFEQKDREALLYVQNNCGTRNTDVSQKINELIRELGNRR